MLFKTDTAEIVPSGARDVLSSANSCRCSVVFSRHLWGVQGRQAIVKTLWWLHCKGSLSDSPSTGVAGHLKKDLAVTKLGNQ